MAKFKRPNMGNINHPGFKKPDSGGQFNSIESKKEIHEGTDKISFKIPAADFAAIIPGSEDNKFMGLQFEFGVKDQNDIFSEHDHIKVHQVFFDLNDGFTREVVQLGGPDGIDAESAYIINTVKTSDGSIQQALNPKFSHYQPASDALSDASTKNYKQLDFFKADEIPDFIFFTRDQVDHIVKNCNLSNGEIILSGGRLQLGRKLAHRPGQHSATYNESYFTIKLEAQDGKEESDNEDNKSQADAATETTVAPNIALGYPCPPDWYLFPRLYGQIEKQLGIPDTENYQSIWNKYSTSTVFHNNGGMAS